LALLNTSHSIFEDAMTHTRAAATLWLALVVLGAAIASTGLARADATLGFREDFSAVGTGGWIGGFSVVFNNPGAGGYRGASDGYLYVQTPAPSSWGVRCRDCPEYGGDWNAAGITQVRLWLNDVGPDESFDIHVVLGNDGNLWQYDTGFAPPEGQWGEFVVDLTSQAGFTQIAGTGTLASALQLVTIFLIRHDPPPFTGPPATPEPIQGDAGIDRILLTNGVVGVEPLPAHVTRALQLSAPYPNPSSGSMRFSLESAVAEAVTLQIVDVTGRMLRRETLPPAAGARVWVWDGLDDRGRSVPPGQYRIRAAAASGGASRSFVRVR
jgi:hypothetical protein